MKEQKMKGIQDLEKGLVSSKIQVPKNLLSAIKGGAIREGIIKSAYVENIIIIDVIGLKI